MRILGLIALALLTACTGAQAPGAGPTAAPTSAPNSEFPVIRWGLFKNYQPVYLAYQKGYFEQAGLNVQMVGNFSSGPAVIQAAGANTIDVGHSAISGIANAVAADVQVIGVADSQTEFKEAPLMQWFVLDSSPIKSAEQLKGKKIGVNSLSGSFYYTVLIYLQQNGLAKDDVTFIVLPHENMEQALRGGQIDVAGTIDPYSVQIQKDGGVRLLFRAVDVIGENQFSHVFFRKAFVDQYPEAVRRFVAAYNQAVEFSYKSSEEASNLMGTFLGITADLTGTHRYTPNVEVRMKDVQFWLDEMRQGGELKDGGKVKPEDIATTAFTPH